MVLFVLCLIAALAVLCDANLSARASGLTQKYCSSLNTAKGGPTYWQYQSNGWCHDHCVDGYAFAIVQDFNCWCSNYAPGVTTSVDNCNIGCPGYTELCGGNGLYGYIELNQKPSGTVGASGAAGSSTPAVTVTKSHDPITVFDTVTRIPSPQSSSVSNSVVDTSPTQRSGGTSAASLTWTPTPVTSVETVTGQVRTVTITPTSPPDSQSSSSSIQQGNSGGSGLSTGQAVGLTVGLVALVGIIAAAIFFYLRRVRRREAGFDIATPVGSSSGPLQPRRMSETSRYMLGTDGRQVVEGWQDDDIAGSRRSRLMPVDPRLNPFAPVYQRGDGSKSRESVATIQDHHDYSRRVVNQQGPILRATNPD